MSIDFVADDEILFHAVLDDPCAITGCYQVVDGEAILLHGAFADRTKKPSVDRMKINGDHPSKTKKNNTDGVVALVAEQVRSISVAYVSEKKVKYQGTVKEHKSWGVDVLPAALDVNPAHALIVCSPELLERDKNAFRKLVIALIQLSEWRIHPASCSQLDTTIATSPH
jgi:hypothetical protein